MAASPPCWWDVGLVLHTRGMVGGKWPLLSVICPTVKRQERCWCVSPLPMAQPWRLGLHKGVAGEAVGATLSLPRKMLFRISPPPLQFQQWKSQAMGWVSPVCSAHPFLVGWLQPVSPCGNEDVGGGQQCQGARPLWRQPHKWEARIVGAWCFSSVSAVSEKGGCSCSCNGLEKMQLRGCWSALPLQLVPVGFKLN